MKARKNNTEEGGEHEVEGKHTLPGASLPYKKREKREETGGGNRKGKMGWRGFIVRAVSASSKINDSGAGDGP